jgi:hypothetical protein
MKKTISMISKTLSILFISVLFSSCNQFGEEVKFKNSSIYYKNISEDEARRSGEFFQSIGYFTDTSNISVQITKPKDSVEIRFVIDKNKMRPELEENFMVIASVLSDSVFKKAPLIVFLSDTDLSDIKRLGVAVPIVETAAPGGDDAGSATSGDVEAILKQVEKTASQLASNVKEVNGNKLYYDNNVEAERVNALLEYLEQGGYFAEGGGHIAVLLKQNNSYVFKEAFTDQQIDSKQTTEALENVATSIKQALFNNDSFSFVVCNLQFQPQLSFMPGAK